MDEKLLGRRRIVPPLHKIHNHNFFWKLELKIKTRLLFLVIFLMLDLHLSDTSSITCSQRWGSLQGLMLLAPL